MTIINTENNCEIFDKFLLDDLVPHSIVSDSTGSTSIVYENSQTEPITIRDADLLTLVNTNIGAESIPNVWYPVFIQDDAYMTTKPLATDAAIQNANGQLLSARIGIEDFVTFRPKFMNWSTSESSVMSIDWVLNQIYFPYSLQYGLLGWVKSIPSTSVDYIGTFGTIDLFPIGSRLVSSNSTLLNIPLIKLDNNHLYRVDRNDQRILPEQNASTSLLEISYNSTSLVKVSDLGSNPQFSLQSPLISSSSLFPRTDRRVFWISNGDFLSYFENDQDKQREYANNIISKSYLSPALYNIYTQIYNIVTANEIRRIDRGMHLKKARLVKKLSFLLSTSPLMSDFGINALNMPDIRNYIEEYINGQGSNSIIAEVESLKNVVVNINAFLQNYTDSTGKAINLGNPLSYRSNTDNLIYDKASLVKKLLNKYGASLKLSGRSSLRYTSALPHGDSLYISQISKNFCSKTLTGTPISSTGANKTRPTTVFNNCTIELQNIKIETNINDTSSAISLTKSGQTKTLPLSDIGKDVFETFFINITMAETTNVTAEFRLDGQNGVTVSPKDPSNYIFETKFPGGNDVVGSAAETSLSFNSVTVATFLESKVSYKWEQIGGSCLKFSDTNKTPKTINRKPNPLFDISRYDNSTAEDPDVYVTKTGEYKIQCTVSTPNGTFVKKKTFYVVNGLQKDENSPTVPSYGKYAPAGSYYQNGVFVRKVDGYDVVVEGISPPSIVDAVEIEPIQINSDHLKIICPSLSEIAIHKSGLFWPIKTLLKYYINDKEYPLEGSQKFYFGSDDGGSNSSSESLLNIRYDTNNTTIKILKIVLKNTRNNTDCNQCLSFFYPNLYGAEANIPGSIPPEKRAVVLRGEKFPEAIPVKEVNWNPVSNTVIKDNKYINFAYPKISTLNAPQVAAYGGYSRSVIDKIGLDIPGHIKPEPNTNSTIFGVANNPQILPVISGYKLDYTEDVAPGALVSDDIKMCYQKAIVQNESSVVFHKGVFHPASGWISAPSEEFDSHANLSSVLKFNPGARDSFSFSGPGLFNLKSSYNSNFDNIPNVYQSSISLSIAPPIVWTPLEKCAPPVTEQERKDNEKKNQRKEYGDQYSGGSTNLHHGYRYLAGGTAKDYELSTGDNFEFVDEFEFTTNKTSCKAGENSNVANSVEYRYGFAAVGPSNPIGSDQGLRDPRVNNFSIQDLEVKLNFLNYVNTKNLVIWLDVVPSAAVQRRLAINRAGTPGCPLDGNDQFVNNRFPGRLYGKQELYAKGCIINDLQTTVPNTGLGEYLYNLIDMNSTNAYEQPLRLYLLNKEHIQNNKFNMSLTFTDSASKHNVLCDHNAFSSEAISLTQNIIHDSSEILPTIAATGYSDISSIDYQNMIKTNQINLENNQFSKFKSKILFHRLADPESRTCPDAPYLDSGTQFILNIMVLDDYDEMITYDMVNNNNLLTGYDTPDIKQRSTEIFNSLCSWELKLHTQKTHKYTASNGAGITHYGNADPLGLIEYGKEPKYLGYSFIANMADNKYLLPDVNLNAPYVYINDISLCDFADPVLKPKMSMLRPPSFPTDAIINIMTGTTAGFTSGGGGIMGATLGFGAGYSAGFNAIVAYLFNTRLYNNISDQARFSYAPNYDNFPFGSPEKILLNISKDGGLWYKLEATIFKYHNTPVLEHNKYKFVKISKGTMPGLSEFITENITNIDQLLDSNLFINLSLDTLDLVSLEEGTGEDTSYVASKLKNLDKITSLPNGSIFKLSCSVTRANDYLSGYYMWDNGVLYRISQTGTLVSDMPINPNILLKSNKLLSYNNILSYDQNDFFSNFTNLVIIEGKIPFYVFNISDNVAIYNNESRDNTNYSTVTIQNKALIIKDNRYYTVLRLSGPMGDNVFISHDSNSDTIVVFKPQSTKIIDQPINAWGLEKSQIQRSTPDTYFSTTGLGSYGNGSSFKDKEILSYKLRKNQLKPIYELFNNHVNDKIKYNNMTIFADITNEDGTVTNSVIPITNTQGAIGYACSVKELKDIFLNGNFKFVRHSNMTDTEYETFISELSNKVADIPDTSMQIIFIKCKDLTAHLDNIQYGDIILEDDYIQKVVTNHLDQMDIDRITSRLESLEIPNETISVNIGRPIQTQSIIDRGSITDLENHYNLLDEDGLDCYQKNTNNQSICYKKLTKQAIYNRYQERNDLIKVLQDQSSRIVSGTTVSYVAKPDNSHILPHVRVSVVSAEQNSNNTAGIGALKIEYQDISKDYYWINIDPKQSCSLAEEDCPKVLIKTTYKCSYANAISSRVHNNICPGDFIGTSKQPAAGGVESIGSGASPGGVGAADMVIPYEVSQSIIDEQKAAWKAKYPDIVWKKNHIVERTFFANDDKEVGSQDLLIKATEVYELAIPSTPIIPVVPLPTEPSGEEDTAVYQKDGSNIANRVYNIFNLDDQLELKVRFRKVPRQVRSIDYYTTVFKYGIGGSTFRPNTAFEAPPELTIGQALNNYFYIWQCLQKDSNGRLKYSTTVPDFLKLQNEMLFRAFYGSSDGIENKTAEMKSLSPWELIPYEYDI